MAREKKGFTRRDLLRALPLGVAGGAGLLAGCKYRTQMFLLKDPPKAEEVRPEWTQSRVRKYRPLGRTGFAMSDISFGCSGLGDASVARYGAEKGINYFDTSPDYSRAGSERALGEGIRGFPREKLFLVSKFCTPDGHLPNDTPVPKVIAAVEASLRRLGTDYLDLVHIHAVNSIDRLMAPNIHEAFDRLKEQGKVRFLGVSSHTPDLETVMRHAVRSGRFDVIMVAYNFRNWPELGDIFREAHERGVGVVAMKTLKGAYHTKLAEFTPTERESFAQAAFKWVLSNPHVSGLVVSMSRREQVDEYLYASGGDLAPSETALLEKYDRLVAREYCRPGCGACLDACPYDVPIDDILRYAMYFENYGHEKEAMRLYAQLDPARRADRCAGCSAPCEAKCEFGLPIRAKVLRAAEELRLV
ncbi:MAG: aldo/keto reductase [Candidatus Binatia bacterium]|nr:MAG: aldo/keto reductase [Candidatus Binatia bacterium]